MRTGELPELHADPAVLRRSLGASDDVSIRETHGSTVFLVGDRAYKLRKPVRFDYADQRPAAARARASERDVALNASLAPGVVLASRSVVPAAPAGSYALSEADDGAAIDHVVEMRRFDDADTMRSRIQARTLTTDQAAAVGERIATFHASATRVPSGVDYRRLVDRNFEALVPLADGLVPPLEWLALQRFATAFLISHSEVLEARAAAGHVIDGHGDLRAEHVLIEGSTVRIIDRLEFDALRVIDVGDELGTLMMELKELTASPALGEAVLAGYHEAGGSAPPDALLAFFGAYRAQVRGKVALLRAGQVGIDADDERAHALRLLALSRRLGWKARGPLVLLVSGRAASGKSTLAAALSAASGLPVLSSDHVRRLDAATAGNYDLAARGAVYRSLGERAAQYPAVIVDATFGTAELQRAFLDGLAGPRPAAPLVVECRAPLQTRLARARNRAAERGSESDAGPEVVAQEDRGFDPMSGVAANASTSIDTRMSVELQVDAVSSWLDALLVSGYAE